MNKNTHEDLITASDQLANEFYNRKLYQQSIMQNETTLALLGGPHPAVFSNMSKAYFQLCRPLDSVALFKKYMSMTGSRDPIDIRQMAQYLIRANLMEEGRRMIFEEQGECNDKHLDMGWFLHRENRFKEAFIETEIGRNGAFWTGDRIPPPCQRWNRQPLRNQKICVIGEAGLGDEIIFCRWIKDLKEQGADVYYHTNNSLRDVITRNFGIKPYDLDLRYDYWVPAMSLPYLIGSEEPGNDVYLEPHVIYVDKWKRRLEGLGEITVLNWTGDRTHIENHLRAIPIDYLTDRIRGKGTLASVCLGADNCPKGVIDLGPEIKTWDDTLAILSLSKRCLTASSSVSVAAAAIGVETHVYDIVVGYFTWCATPNGERTNWFKDARVWRQDEMGYWKTPIDRSLSFIGWD
jgi:hypothetical protein